MAVKQLLLAWWRIITRPSVATFEQAGQDVSLPVALAGLVLAHALSVLIAIAGKAWLGNAPLRGGLTVALWPFLFPLVVFGYLCFCLFIAGRLVSGQSQLRDYVHLFALFMAPLSLLVTVLDLIPLLPSWVALGFFDLYGVLLTVQALRVIHHYTVPRALATIGVSVLVWLGFALLLALLAQPLTIDAPGLRELFAR